MYEGVPDYVETGTAQTNDALPRDATGRTATGRPTTRRRRGQPAAPSPTRPCGSSCPVNCVVPNPSILVVVVQFSNVDLTRWRCDDCGGTEDIPEPPVEQFEGRRRCRR